MTVTPLPYAPGDWVELKTMPGWGLGQVQSVTGNRVTVNFEHGGKQLIRADQAVLSPASPGPEIGTEKRI